MRKLFPVLLIGSLSMLFAEVFSGASQSWFINGWGLLVTLPLYLVHTLLLLSIALKSKKMKLSQLYLFGVLFSLYESWITKVLWTGYMDSAGPGITTILGLAIPEFPILVFFWHPIMSFILPILTFEILTKKIPTEHKQALQKTKTKTALIIILLISTSTFIARGSQFNQTSANISIIGTLLLISALYTLSKKSDLTIFKFKKTALIIMSIYLALLYTITFALLFPQKIPTTILPYISILIFYAIPILLISKSKTTKTKFTNPNKNQYSNKDLIKFALIMILATNIATLSQGISSIILAITYLLLIPIGTMIFIITIYKMTKTS